LTHCSFLKFFLGLSSVLFFRKVLVFELVFGILWDFSMFNIWSRIKSIPLEDAFQLPVLFVGTLVYFEPVEILINLYRKFPLIKILILLILNACTRFSSLHKYESVCNHWIFIIIQVGQVALFFVIVCLCVCFHLSFCLFYNWPLAVD
jgi:hypothetical protein